MSHYAQRRFCDYVHSIHYRRFVKATVLDVGSLDVNGGNRRLFMASEYLGIDYVAGKGVDRVCSIHEVEGQFSVVISTEALEHDPDWQRTLEAMVERCAPGGLIIITCAGPGRQEHGTRAHPIEGMACESDYYRNISPIDLLAYLPIEQFKYYETRYLGDRGDTYLWAIKCK